MLRRMFWCNVVQCALQPAQHQPTECAKQQHVARGPQRQRSRAATQSSTDTIQRMGC